MSIDYKATFSSCLASEEKILKTIKNIVNKYNILFPDDQKIIRSINQKKKQIYLPCFSQALQTVDNSLTNLEVDFSLKEQDQKWLITYRESATAFYNRQNNKALADNLYNLLFSLCSRLNLEICIYDEEPTTAIKPPDIKQVRSILKGMRFPSGGKDGCLIFSSKLLSIEAAKKLMPARQEELTLTDNSLIILKFPNLL